MATISLEEKNIQIFFIRNLQSKKKWLWDFKKYIIKSWKIEKENISENIDNFLYN